MNNTDARKFIFNLTEQVEQAPEGSITEALAPLLMNTIMEIESIESQMRSELRSIADRAERAQKALNEGMNLNSLGEFHTSPADFDRLCARRQDQYMVVQRVVAAMNKDGADISVVTLCAAIAAKGA